MSHRKYVHTYQSWSVQSLANSWNSDSHLSRRDLYAYGFKEGEAWRDDRRALEAALWEIDQLERQTEYEYHRRPSPSDPWTSGRSSSWRPSHHSCGPPNARYHDAQITRNNSDLYPTNESGMTSLSSQSHARYNDDSRYQSGYIQPTYPSSHAVPSVFYGCTSSQNPRDYHSPQYASPPRPSNANYQDFRDSTGISHSSSHQTHSFAPSMAPSSYGPSHHPQDSYSSHDSPVQQISTPGQLQMVARRSGRNESLSPEHTVDPRCAWATRALSPPSWSMVATEGTARSMSPSMASSQGMYSRHLRDMGYVGTASRTNGYAESFDNGEFYGSSDEEFMSDDAGSYCSSDSGAEEWEHDEEGPDDYCYSSSSE